MSLQIARCQLFRIDLARFGLKTLAGAQEGRKESWCRRGKRYYCSSSPPDSTTQSQSQSAPKNVEDVTVKYIRGLPHVTVPLPSRNERCQFALRPVSHNVGDFLNMLHEEDRGIDRAAVLSNEGIRISSACSIENLMDDSFWLHINDKQYHVMPPIRDKITSEELTKIGDVRVLVAQLYEALHVGEHQIKKERELHEKLEELNSKISPLEKKKSELEMKAVRRTNILTWVGLGFMSVQFGIIARLTWWEYSWDIMEPVTYFVTYGTAMAAYAYYCITKQEYVLEDVRDRQYLISMHKRAKKQGLDLMTYNQLRREIADVEQDLRRLRDPLHLHVPAVPKKYYDEFDSDGKEITLSASKKIRNILNAATKRLKK
ncbi:calcium uniporter protein, mitochondrial [Lutzomyia longipalpis]|nr:calcium uniporter protein, mitochondrial [Lutzomyia longipalpis]